jgi:3-hydroxyisobutyrate dehydrogenase-like beta-hydroxyacid dehydrogenase
MDMRIAVLGMGNMGKGVATRLLGAGNDVVVWNRSPGKADDLVERGATEVGSIEAAVLASDIVITSLANDEAVRHVALDDGGVGEHLGDALYVDASTISPALSAELAEVIPRFVAMPIAGSPEAVSDGKATYLVGGPEEARAQLRPVLDSLSSGRREYEAAPLASVAKLATNLLLLVNVEALAESFEVGRSGGLTDDQLRELLAESPMVAPGVRNRFEAVLTGDGPGWWSIELGLKDAGLALAVGGDKQLPAATMARDRFSEGASHGLGGEDIAAVARLFRNRGEKEGTDDV